MSYKILTTYAYIMVDQPFVSEENNNTLSQITEK